jgi:hypothetical protein
MSANSNWPFDPADFAKYTALPERYKGAVWSRVSRAIRDTEYEYFQRLCQKEDRVQKAKSTTKLRLIKGGQS